MCADLAELKGNAIVFDTVHNFSPSAHPEKNTLPGYQYLHSARPSHLKAIVRDHLEKKLPFKIVYQPDGDPEEHIEAVCKIVKAAGTMIFAIDEIWYLCTPEWLPDTLKWLVFCGRHRNISMIATAQVPRAVARKFTSQCAEMRIFSMHEGQDIKYFKDFIGRHADQLLDLERFYYLVWERNGEAYVTGGPK